MNTTTVNAVEKPSPTAPTDREVAHDVRADLERAEREHALALSRWRHLREVAAALDTHGVLIEGEQRPAGRTLRAPATPKGRRLDDVDLDVAKADVARQRRDAARHLQVARQRLDEAKAVEANRRLPELARRHAAAAGAVERERDRLEAVYLEFAVRVIRLREAYTAEVEATRTLVKAALDGTGSDAELRERLQQSEAAGRVPVALAVAGGVAQTAERPQIGLFGLSGDSFNPLRSEPFAAELGEIIGGGRRRLGATAERVEARIRKALARADDE